LRCFHCATHREQAPGLLADAVAAMSYSVSGTPYARALWQYKGDTARRDPARAALRTLLLVFLHEHGRCLWARAGVPGPSHLAVVPTGRGRPGPHPLRAVVQPYLTLPWVPLVTTPGDPFLARSLYPGRFQVAGAVGRNRPLAGAAVLLLDDTWTTGGSAQSAAAALKLGGAETVIIVTLGRHLNLSCGLPDSFTVAVRDNVFRLDRCAVHGVDPDVRGTWLTSGSAQVTTMDHRGHSPKAG
jgi:hypothetical protein